MPEEPIPPEVAFFKSPLGGVITVVVSLVLFGAVAWWALRPDAPAYRKNLLYASLFGAVLLSIMSVVAVSAGWWKGSFFEIPLLVLAAIHLPLGAAGWWLWLMGYRWLETHTRRPLLVYAPIALVFIPVVLFTDPRLMQRGLLDLGGGYTVWTDALAGQIAMWSPVLFYGVLQRPRPAPVVAAS